MANKNQPEDQKSDKTDKPKKPFALRPETVAYRVAALRLRAHAEAEKAATEARERVLARAIRRENALVDAIADPRLRKIVTAMADAAVKANVEAGDSPDVIDAEYEDPSVDEAPEQTDDYQERHSVGWEGEPDDEDDNDDAVQSSDAQQVSAATLQASDESGIPERLMTPVEPVQGVEVNRETGQTRRVGKGRR